jgi:hypothetical protein
MAGAPTPVFLVLAARPLLSLGIGGARTLTPARLRRCPSVVGAKSTTATDSTLHVRGQVPGRKEGRQVPLFSNAALKTWTLCK